MSPEQVAFPPELLRPAAENAPLLLRLIEALLWNYEDSSVVSRVAFRTGMSPEDVAEVFKLAETLGPVPPLPEVEPIEVACAIIMRQMDRPRVLMTQRRPGTDYAYSWEFPGGKLKPGESPGDAVCREVREKLGCGCGVVRQVCEATELASDGRAVHMTFWVVHVFGEVHMDAAIGLGWFAAEELVTVNHTPGGAAVVHQIADALSSLELGPQEEDDDVD